MYACKTQACFAMMKVTTAWSGLYLKMYSTPRNNVIIVSQWNSLIGLVAAAKY